MEKAFPFHPTISGSSCFLSNATIRNILRKHIYGQNNALWCFWWSRELDAKDNPVAFGCFRQPWYPEWACCALGCNYIVFLSMFVIILLPTHTWTCLYFCINLLHNLLNIKWVVREPLMSSMCQQLSVRLPQRKHSA